MRTYHLAHLLVVPFMFCNVSAFFANILADRVWLQSKGPTGRAEQMLEQEMTAGQERISNH